MSRRNRRTYRPQPKNIPYAAFLEALNLQLSRERATEASFPFLGKESDKAVQQAVHDGRVWALGACLKYAEKLRNGVDWFDRLLMHFSWMAHEKLNPDGSPVGPLSGTQADTYRQIGWKEGCYLSHALALQGKHSSLQQQEWFRKQQHGTFMTNYAGIPGTETILNPYEKRHLPCVEA